MRTLWVKPYEMKWVETPFAKMSVTAGVQQAGEGPADVFHIFVRGAGTIEIIPSVDQITNQVMIKVKRKV